MSKGRGKKIVVKFNKALLGDVSGNHTAFTVTGMEKNPLFHGEPQQRQYNVASVERYPVAVLYEDDFEGGVSDGVEVGGNGLVLGKSSNVVGTSATGAAYQLNSNTRRDGQTFTPGKGFDQVELSAPSWSDNIGTLVLSLYDGVARTNLLATATHINYTDNAWIGVSFGALPAGTYYLEWQTPDHTKGVGAWGSSTNVYAGGSAYVNGVAQSYDYNVRWREVEYSTPGTYTPPPIPTATLPESPRLRYEADTPTDTSITIEYATSNSDTEPPEAWIVADDSDLLTIDGDFLWLRYTLETQDTAVTPTLLAVWIEEAEAPPDKIILHFDENNRFNNVESDITVAYNQAIGNLAGTRAVESFSQAFTPLDLEPTPHHQHTISVEGTGVLVDLLPVTYIDSDHEHTISVQGTEVLVDLIHVDDIPP